MWVKVGMQFEQLKIRVGRCLHATLFPALSLFCDSSQWAAVALHFPALNDKTTPSQIKKGIAPRNLNEPPTARSPLPTCAASSRDAGGSGTALHSSFWPTDDSFSSPSAPGSACAAASTADGRVAPCLPGAAALAGVAAVGGRLGCV
eukprot:1156184-Pelagomonas_calceolata.AAC.15